MKKQMKTNTKKEKNHRSAEMEMIKMDSMR